MSLAHSISTPPIRHGRVLSVELRQDAAVCVIADKTRLLLSRFLGSRVAVGDDIAYAVPTGDEVGTEILITKHAVTGPSRYLYHAPIGYVSQPKVDKRNQGEPSRDGQTFFARRVIAFSPELRRRRFRLALRRCEFYDGRALCRDVRRKLEFWLDPAILHTVWDPTWNQWKHLLETKIEVEGTFVQSGKYRMRRGA